MACLLSATAALLLPHMTLAEDKVLHCTSYCLALSSMSYTVVCSSWLAHFLHMLLISFCMMPRPCIMTGILLRRFLGDPTLQGVSHVVIDEVHERSVDVDLSLLLLRDLIAQGSSIKVILMSATANAELFAAYFNNTCHKVPILTPLLDSATGDVGGCSKLSALSNTSSD